MTAHSPNPVAALSRKVARAAERQKGVRLSQHELDILILAGGLDALTAMALESTKARCHERSAPILSINGADTASISALNAPGNMGGGMKSSGMMPSESASEALQRAMAMSGLRGPNLTAST